MLKWIKKQVLKYKLQEAKNYQRINLIAELIKLEKN